MTVITKDLLLTIIGYLIMNSKAVALYAFDEQLSSWLSGPSKTATETFSTERALKELSKTWPYILKILADGAGEYPDWQRFAVLAADRLILSCRKLPIEKQENRVRALSAQLADREIRASETIAERMVEEKNKFFAQYASVESSIHRATDYWEVWEPTSLERVSVSVREEISSIREALSREQSILASLSTQQSILRDKWGGIRARLLGGDLLSGQEWWGAVRADTNSTSSLPEWIEFQPPSTTLLNELHQSLARLNIAASLRVGVQGEEIWDALRIQLVQIAQLAIGSDSFTLLSTALLNTLDALLALLFTFESISFAERQKQFTRALEVAEEEISRLQSQLADPAQLAAELLRRDRVVAQFVADSKNACADAAIRKGVADLTRKLQKDLNDRTETLERERIRLKALIEAKRKSFEEPWGVVLTVWRGVAGSEAALRDNNNVVKIDETPKHKTKTDITTNDLETGLSVDAPTESSKLKTPSASRLATPISEKVVNAIAGTSPPALSQTFSFADPSAVAASAASVATSAANVFKNILNEASRFPTPNNLT